MKHMPGETADSLKPVRGKHFWSIFHSHSSGGSCSYEDLGGRNHRQRGLSPTRAAGFTIPRDPPEGTSVENVWKRYLRWCLRDFLQSLCPGGWCTWNRPNARETQKHRIESSLSFPRSEVSVRRVPESNRHRRRESLDSNPQTQPSKPPSVAP